MVALETKTEQAIGQTIFPFACGKYETITKYQPLREDSNDKLSLLQHLPQVCMMRHEQRPLVFFLQYSRDMERQAEMRESWNLWSETFRFAICVEHEVCSSFLSTDCTTEVYRPLKSLHISDTHMDTNFELQWVSLICSSTPTKVDTPLIANVSTECSSRHHFHPDDDWSIQSKCRQSYFPNSSW